MDTSLGPVILPGWHCKVDYKAKAKLNEDKSRQGDNGDLYPATFGQLF